MSECKTCQVLECVQQGASKKVHMSHIEMTILTGILSVFLSQIDK